MAGDPEMVRVDCIRDEEAGVWIAINSGGLVLEDASLDRLLPRIQQALPEIRTFNKEPLSNKMQITLHLGG